MPRLADRFRFKERRRSWRLALAALSLLLAASPAHAEPALRCLWRAPRSAPAVASRTARVQYTQFFDDALVALLAHVLGPDRTLRFRYEKDWPDDHVFPNGVSMGRIHAWLTAMLDAWNREPLMPLRLRLDRGAPSTENVIFLDDTNKETTPNTGLGGYNYSYSGDQVQFRSRAILNVAAGSLDRRELFEAIAKHELGHCLTLRHCASRASAMGYTTGTVDYGASQGFFVSDDLLGLRSVWARNASGFGSLAGRVVYPDGTAVGGADVAAVDEATGDVIATGMSDPDQRGRFRIELPAGRRVRLTAHPMHADAALFGEHFLPAALLSPGEFEPTEYREGDRSAVFTIPDGATRELSTALTVAAPATRPLRNLDAPVAALLPGQRGHMAFRFSGLGSEPVQVRASLSGLTLSNVTQVGDRVEFDVSASADAVGASTVEFHRGNAANVQVGSIWVRPVAGLARATGVAPAALSRGATTEVAVTGYGLDGVTGVRLEGEGGASGPEAHLAGPASGGSLNVKVTVPSSTGDGPWELQLLTAEGEAPRAVEPQPRLWATRGYLQADPLVDLGEVKVGQPAEVTVGLTNRTAKPYQLTRYRWSEWLGMIDGVKITDVPDLAPGGSGTLTFMLTPRQLGPAALSFGWLSGNALDAITEVRLWAVP